MTPSFSVVVPVYNVEPYLRQCIDSILGQSFSDFELILVDDGSPDGCPAICDEYAARDSRITVIHQQNAGLAKARKSGLLRASADYVCFVDSDDWVVPHWLETVWKEARANGLPDIVLFEQRRDVGESSNAILAQPGYYDKARLEAEIYPYMLCDRRRKPFGWPMIPAFVWSRATRRELLLAHYIEDDSGITLYEDIAMSYECMYYARNMVIISEPLYIYRQREGSILSGARPRYFAEIKACYDYLRSHLGGKDAALDWQINASYLFKVIGGFVWELDPAGDVRQAARRVRAGLGQTDTVRVLSFAGLPVNMKLFLALLKCKLFLPATWLVKLRM